MAVVERGPRGRLRGVVERFWLVEDEAPAVDPETICPDGTTEIVLHLGDRMRQSIGGVDYLQSRSLLVGQMDSPVVITPTGRMSMVGARLAPGALHRLLPIPQHEIARQILDLETVWRQWTRQTADRVACIAPDEARLDAFEHALERLMPAAAPSSASIDMNRAIARLRASAGRASIPKLACDLGISRRQFERRFHDHVGLSPALFARILKFQHAFHALGAESGAMVAARCGYVDQAHLVREIRRFSGQTPTVLSQADGLTAFFRG